MKTTTLKQLKKDLLKDKAIKRAYDALGPEFTLVRQIVNKRLEAGLSQQELAKKIGTGQSAISRLESGEYNPSIDMLRKVARALDAKVSVTFK